MNKLRAVSWGGGTLVVALSVWAALYYGGAGRFAGPLLVGVLAAGLPGGLWYLKDRLRSLRRRLASEERLGGAEGSIFVSESAVDDGLECLEAIRDAATAADDYDEVRRDAFAEGPGLTVLHAGFHNSFVRVTERGRVVVTGASDRTRDLARLAADTYSLSFERTRDNPFERARPVKGAPRVFLGVLVVVLVLVGVHAVAATAYPAGMYNPAERTILVGIDGQASLDPGVSGTEATLRKAAFHVAMVEESPTEIRWANNDSDRVTTLGRRALATADEAHALLATLHDRSLTPAQAARVDELERRLAAAERDSAAALDERAASGGVNDTRSLSRLSDRLRASANESAQAAAVRQAEANGNGTAGGSPSVDQSPRRGRPVSG